jgi:hypothetical protein
LRTCQKLRVPGVFRVSDFRPRELPFSEKFDLVYAYSVFTGNSSYAMARDGVVIVTFRHREFIIYGAEIERG